MSLRLGKRRWRRAIGLLAIGVVACSLSAYGVMRQTSDQESAADLTPAARPLGVNVDATVPQAPPTETTDKAEPPAQEPLVSSAAVIPAATRPGAEGGPRQGGDTCDAATFIGLLPYSDTGTTVGYADDYDFSGGFTCPWASTSGDVVYEYTPALDRCVDVTLCNGSSYDTKLMVYENACVDASIYNCDDDACPGYVSEIMGLQLTGGNTYYFVVDGYAGAVGNYIIDVTPCSQGACCVDEVCVATTSLADCDALAGWWFPGEACPDTGGSFVCPPHACDDALYHNGQPDQVTDLACERGGLIVPDAWTVDDVTFAEDVTIGDLHWWAATDDDYGWVGYDDVIILEANGTGGGPGTVIYEAIDVPNDRIYAGYDHYGIPVYLYSLVFDPGSEPQLAAGTYWIGMRPVGTTGSGRSYWSTTADNGTSPVYFKGPYWGFDDWTPSIDSFGTDYHVAFCVTGTSTSEVCIPPGQDCWSTWCGSGTQADFSMDPIPAGFFDPGSDPFDGIIDLGAGYAWPDTIIQRLDQLCFSEPLPSSDTVPIELVQLDLVSCAPIDVGGSGLWDAHVTVTPLQPLGTMTATMTHANGGTFTADFYVPPVYTFTRVDPPYDVVVFDTGAWGIPPIFMQTRGDAPWSDNETYEFCTLDGFAGGMSEDDDGVPCCEEVCHDAGPGYPEGHMHCTRPPECPPCPPPCTPDGTIDAPGTFDGDTTGAGDDCALRTGEDQIIAVNIPYDGTWAFSLCGGATWDTYMFVGTTCCGQEVGYNDDDCSYGPYGGSLQSEVRATITAGTYYVDVEPYSSSVTGLYTLSVFDVYGACCDEVTGVCIDGTLIDDCYGPDLRFENGTLCADLDPPCGAETCEAVAARSYREHGAAGRLGLDMGLSDGIEPRLGGIQELEIDLAPGGGAAFGGEAWVSCSDEWPPGSTHAGDYVPAVAMGDTVIAYFAPPLPDEAWCVVELDCGAHVCVRGLEGDIDRNGLVSTGDASIIKPKFGQTPTTATAQFDYDVSGLISTGDFSQVKPKFGHTAPGCRCQPNQDPWGTIFNDTLPDNGTAIEFGSADIPPIAADFFGPGSDPFEGTVALIGDAVDLRRTGMTDTMIQRTGPVCFPGDPTVFPRPSDTVELRIVELSLMAPEPMIVTYFGGLDPEEWLMVMTLAQNQEPGSLDAMLESEAGGTFVADVPVTPLCVFILVSDLQLLEEGAILPEDVNIRTMDFELEGIDPIHMGWDEPVPFSTTPPSEGFSCECNPCGGICFYPGVHEAGRQVNPPHIAAGGPGHLHYINPPPPPPKFCWYREIGFNSTNCFWWHWWPGPIYRTGIQCNTIGNCPPWLIRVYPCWPAGGFCVHFAVPIACR